MSIFKTFAEGLNFLHLFALSHTILEQGVESDCIKWTGSVWLTPYSLPFLSKQVNSLPADKLQEIQKAIELFSVGQGPAKTMEEATRRSYQFWDTQPVPKLGKTLN